MTRHASVDCSICARSNCHVFHVRVCVCVSCPILLGQDFLKPPGGAGSPKTPTKTPTKTPRDPWPRGGHASGCAVGASPSGASSSPEALGGVRVPSPV